MLGLHTSLPKHASISGYDLTKIYIEVQTIELLSHDILDL